MSAIDSSKTMGKHAETRAKWKETVWMPSHLVW